MQRYIDCMESRRFSVELIEMPGGVYVYNHSGGPGFDETSWECRVGTTAVIEPLYVGLLQNPEGKAPNVAQVECLQRRGLLPRDYSVTDYQTDFVDGFSSYFDLSDPETLQVFELCSYNPSM